jgi:uncharacterized protein
MPAQTVIDSLEFARTGQLLGGSLPISGLLRLKDSLFDGLGEVRFEVKGAHDTRRRPVLVLEVSGVLHLQCQRCLGLLDFPLRLSNTLLLASTADEGGGFEQEDAEWIEASTELDVAGLVEDEIILSLPYSPRHGNGLCGQGGGREAGETGSAAFAKLAALKRNSH